MGKTNSTNDELEKAMKDLAELGKDDDKKDSVAAIFAKSIASLAQTVTTLVKSKVADKKGDTEEAVVDDDDQEAGTSTNSDDDAEDIEDIEDDDEPDDLEDTAKSRNIEENFYKSLAGEDDGNKAVVEVVEASEAMEKLVDTLGKGFGTLEDHNIQTQQQLDLMMKGFTVLVNGVQAIAKSVDAMQSKIDDIAATSTTPTGMVGIVGPQKTVKAVESDTNGNAQELTKSQIAARLFNLVQKGEADTSMLRRLDSQGIQALPKDILQKLNIVVSEKE